MTYEEWLKLVVFSTDIRTIEGIDNFDYDNGPMPGAAFMKPRYRKDNEHIIEGFDNVGYIYQHAGLWYVQITNTDREFVYFKDAARYLWYEWVRGECFGQFLDWNKSLVWSTGEELVVIDGPSFDGRVEVRAPIEYAKLLGKTSCFIDQNTGQIAGTPSAPHVVNA
jgi:hypothetical protein